MDSNDLRVDRRTLLRAASFLSVIPDDVGGAGATDPSDGAAGTPGAGAPPTPPVEGYAYGGAPVVAAGPTTGASLSPVGSDDATRDDPQGYGENGYGGAVP